ncbi:MAG: branched-chain amino acid ABC transporter permease [Chloroflexota bacterium]
MVNFVQFLTNGILVGGVYAVVALGIVLIYKATRVFNFAVGEMMVVGGFLCWSLLAWAGVPVWPSFLVALLGSFVLGLIIERLSLRPLIGQPLLAAIMATLAVSSILRGVVILGWSAYTVSFPTPIFPEAPLWVAGVSLSQGLLLSFVLAMVAFALFVFFFQRTKTGLAMRATAEDHQVARATGVRVTRVFALTWAIAGVLAAIGGIMVSDRMALGVTETAAVGLKAFPAVLFGGLDSIPGAIVGGIAVGVLENLASGLIDPKIGEVTPYVILLLVLLFKTEGLFGLKRIERI